MKLEHMYIWPDIAKIRQTIFWGRVEEIISPEDAERYESGLPGVVISGVELDFLVDGQTKQGGVKGYLFPYSTYLENIDMLKVGTSVRILSTRNLGGSTENASPILEFTRLENN